MPEREPLSHDQLDAFVVRLRLGVDASELHGSLCGYLAGGARPHGHDLLPALQLESADNALGDADQALLDGLLAQCRDALEDSDLGFEPLLPEDDRPLDVRAEAVAAWCRGFLGGFGLAGPQAHADLSADAQEVLRDFGTIAASAFAYEDAEEDEDALIEVQEFLRVGALLLYTESAARNAPHGHRVH